MGTLSVRLEAELEEKLKFIMKEKRIQDKSAYVRQLLSKSLTEDIIDYLCNEVKNRRMSAWKAATIVNLPLRTILTELANRKIDTMDELSFQDDLAFIRGK